VFHFATWQRGSTASISVRRWSKKARARNLYDNLLVGDIENTLDGTTQYDLLLAADTLVYLGDLELVFDRARRNLHDNGFFLLPSKAKKVKISSWDQSADGATPRPICGNRPPKRGSMLRVSWQRCHAMRQIGR